MSQRIPALGFAHLTSAYDTTYDSALLLPGQRAPGRSARPPMPRRRPIPSGILCELSEKPSAA